MPAQTPDKPGDPFVSLSGAHAATSLEPFDSEPSPVAADEPVDDSVQMHIAAPWRFSEFRTPLLPGVVLTPEWRSYPPDVAATLYSEAVRCGFTVSTSSGANEGEKTS